MIQSKSVQLAVNKLWKWKVAGQSFTRSDFAVVPFFLRRLPTDEGIETRAPRQVTREVRKGQSEGGQDEGAAEI